MRTDQEELWKSLENTQQIIVPIYQRKYSWKPHECKQLWDDIIQAANNNESKSYFIGTMVYVIDTTNPSNVSRYHVIDGQQRLTSIFLLLAAFRNFLDRSKNHTITKEEIHSLLINKFKPDQKYKLILTKSDDNTLKCIIDGEDYPEDPSIMIKNNFEYFEEMVTQVEPKLLCDGLHKLKTVQITLDGKDENPQLIFESLNSTGLGLSKTDLIRNYILMSLSPNEQTEIYINHWEPMEKNFENYDSFDEFIKDFLIIKNNIVIKTDNIYTDFKEYFKREKKKKIKIIDLVKDLKYHSKLFTMLLYGETDLDDNLKIIMKNINELNASVVRPFLLKILIYHDDNKINNEELLQIFSMVESYLLRRAVCDLHRQGLNQAFPKLIGKMDGIVDNYFEEIKGLFFGTLVDTLRFPNNEEFYDGFIKKNIYKLKNRMYILYKFENNARKKNKEHVEIHRDDADYQIEHILPQNYNSWKNILNDNDLTEIDPNLHVIGNLTLTGYNQKLSDKPFQDKLTMDGGFKQSPLLLNKYISTFTNWGISEIQQRSKKLADEALVIWKYYEPSDIILKKYTVNDRTASLKREYTEEEYFAGEYTPNEVSKSTLRLFDYFKNRIFEEFPHIVYRPQSVNCAFHIDNSPICSIQVLTTRLKLSYKNDKNSLPNSPFIKHMVNKTGKKIGHWGIGDYESIIKNGDDVEQAILFLKK